MQIVRPRRLDRGVLLQDDAYRLVRLGGGLGAGDRLRTAEGERRDDAREQHGVSRRQEDERAVGQIELGVAARRRGLLRGLLRRNDRLAGFGGLYRLFNLVHVFATQTSELVFNQPTLAKVSTRHPWRSSRAERRKRGERATRRSKHPYGISSLTILAFRSLDGRGRVPVIISRSLSISTRTASGGNAGQGGDDPQLPLGLEHVDRRLPARGAAGLARGLEELPVQLLGLLQQRASFREHLVFRVTHRRQPLVELQRSTLSSGPLSPSGGAQDKRPSTAIARRIQPYWFCRRP